MVSPYRLLNLPYRRNLNHYVVLSVASDTHDSKSLPDEEYPHLVPV